MSTLLRADVDDLRSDLDGVEGRVRDLEDAALRLDARLKQLDQGVAVALRVYESAWRVLELLAARVGVQIVVEHAGTARAKVELVPVGKVWAGPVQ
jgi:hypothetical protein